MAPGNQSSPTRPTWAEINLDAFAENLQAVRARVGKDVKIMAVVKANAYGHGAVEIAQEALANGAEMLGVAIPEEGVQLRNAGLSAPILVFTSPPPEQIPIYFNHELLPAIASLESAEQFEREAELRNMRIGVHVKVDTGMGRLGFQWTDAHRSIIDVARLRHLDILGVFSHFASADERDKQYAKLQLQRFADVLDSLRNSHLEIPEIHIANSAAILDIPESFFTMVRPGIMLYGYYPSHETTESMSLRPVMSIKSRIVHLKHVCAGTSISYNRRYVTTHDTWIATVPLGYADGYSRLLTNRASVLINGHCYPVVGTVTMDHIMIDVGDGEVKLGDEVVLLGSSHEQRITAWDLADKIGTIPYEITCAISSRVPRVYIRDT
ncbi:MAG: alanine racemase [Bacteroidota bacterium]